MAGCSGTAFGGHGEPCAETPSAVVQTTNRKSGRVYHRLACEGHARAALANCRATWKTTVTERLPLSYYSAALDPRAKEA